MFNIYEKDESFVEPDEQLYYLLASNGLFQIKKTIFFTASTLVFGPIKNKSMGWLQSHQVSITVHLPKKFPTKVMEQIKGFFEEVHDTLGGAEVIVLIYWNEDKQKYVVVAPDQDVAFNALPYYKIGRNPPGFVKFGDAHSHGRLPAFHSAVDQKDEEFDDGFHITIGNVDAMPSISCEVVSDGQRFKVNPRVLLGEGGKAQFPTEWMENVHKVEIVEVDGKSFYHKPKGRGVVNALKNFPNGGSAVVTRPGKLPAIK